MGICQSKHDILHQKGQLDQGEVIIDKNHEKHVQSIPLSKFGGGVGASCNCGRFGLGGGCGLCKGCNCFGLW